MGDILQWRPEVVAFADLMEARLRANDQKPGWKGDSPRLLWHRIMDEMHELGAVLSGPAEIDPAAAGKEAADVSNFAMMVADVCGALELRPRDPWLPLAGAPKSGKMVWLLIDYREGEHALVDSQFGATIGFNQFEDTGEDRWQFAGWCWTHDHFTEGAGVPVGWKEIGFELEPPRCFRPISTSGSVN